MVIGAKYHSNSAYPPKFLVQFEAKYSPQIAPEAVSEHGYVKNFLGGGGGGGGYPQTPPICWPRPISEPYFSQIASDQPITL